MSDKRSKLFMECMDFLYTWVDKGIITNGIRKGTVEDLEAFVTKKLEEMELLKVAQNMVNAQQILPAEEGVPKEIK